MSIDPVRYHSPATKAEVGGVAIQTAVALSTLTRLFKAVRAGNQLSDDDINDIERVAKNLEEIFDNLSGWTK